MSVQRHEGRREHDKGPPKRPHLAVAFVLGVVDLTALVISFLGPLDISVEEISLLALTNLAVLSPFYKHARLAKLLELSNIEHEMKEARKELGDVLHSINVMRQNINISQFQFEGLQPKGGTVEKDLVEATVAGRSTRDIDSALAELCRLAAMTDKRRQEEGLTQRGRIKEMCKHLEVLADREYPLAQQMLEELRRWLCDCQHRRYD